MSIISDRIKQLIDNEDISVRALEQKIGCSNGVISKCILKGTDINSNWVSKIIESFPNYSSRWLLTGTGLMISKNETGMEDEIRTRKKGQIDYQFKNDFHLRTDSRKESQVIPLYDMEAVAGLVPLFNEALKYTPIDYISIPNLTACDGAIYITGDSMYPLLKSGDIVLYKAIHDFINSIFWGEMYLLSIDIEGEEYIMVKYIQKSDLPEHVRLVSYNQHHNDKDVLISSIRAVAFVKASIRINSMK